MLVQASIQESGDTLFAALSSVDSQPTARATPRRLLLPLDAAALSGQPPLRRRRGTDIHSTERNN